MTNHEAALEAAAKHLYNNDPEGMNAQGFGEPWETFAPTNDIPAPYYRHLVNTAIREYQRQMAPAVREAVVPVGADNALAEVVSELVALRLWINENDTRYHDTFNFGSVIVEWLDDMIADYNARGG